MSATEGLRELLDGNRTWWRRPIDARTGEPIQAQPMGDDGLGRETCRILYRESDYGMDGWLCEGCGEWFAATYNNTPTNNIRTPNFCPNCGRRVVE